ncbi:hypothetical protein [Candidatus Hodarchaeum mangrovi]
MNNHEESQNSFPSPEILVKWWNEAEREVKLAHPHEPKRIRDELIERYVQARIRNFRNQKTEGEKQIEFSEQRVAEWFQNEMIKLREEKPGQDLKERELIAAERVQKQINDLKKKIIPLDTFFTKE